MCSICVAETVTPSRGLWRMIAFSTALGIESHSDVSFVVSWTGSRNGFEWERFLSVSSPSWPGALHHLGLFSVLC